MRCLLMACLTACLLKPVAAWTSDQGAVESPAERQPGMVALDIGRDAARVPLFVWPSPGAKATLVLLPGGDAGTGKIVDGQPGSRNFLSRSRALFQAQGFHVIVAYRASDLPDLAYEHRTTPAHIDEIAKVVDWAHRQFGQPVWLVGTSRGSVSATAAAIALGPSRVQGLVLTSSVTSGKPGAVPTQDLARIQVPTLVVHHRLDACHVCRPREAALIPDALIAAPRKQFILVEGGFEPQGDACEALHWHGFVHFEKETVGVIAGWIRESLAVK